MKGLVYFFSLLLVIFFVPSIIIWTMRMIAFDTTFAQQLHMIFTNNVAGFLACAWLVISAIIAGCMTGAKYD